MALFPSKPTSTLVTFYLFFILLGSWIVAAQNIPDLPACAQPCANSAAQASGCSSSDAVCLCKNNSFQAATLQCASKTCPKEDQAGANAAVQGFCAAAIPPSTTSSSTSSTSQSASSTPHSTSTKPGQTSPSSQNSNPSLSNTNSNGQGTVTITATTSIPPQPSTAPSTPFTTFSLPSSAITTPDSTSVVLQTVTPTPSSNAAVSRRTLTVGTFAGLLSVTVLGMMLGSLIVS